jgi:hypothetical protein
MTTNPNPYERAAERFNRISADLPHIKALAQAVIDWADDEYDAASVDLARYESSPGILLPRYRGTVTS